MENVQFFLDVQPEQKRKTTHAKLQSFSIFRFDCLFCCCCCSSLYFLQFMIVILLTEYLKSLIEFVLSILVYPFDADSLALCRPFRIDNAWKKKQNALNIIAHFQSTFDNQSADESLECQVRTIMTAILVTLMTV